MKIKGLSPKAQLKMAIEVAIDLGWNEDFVTEVANFSLGRKELKKLFDLNFVDKPQRDALFAVLRLSKQYIVNTYLL